MGGLPRTASCRRLIEVLGEIEDPRKPRGIRHRLSAVLGLACAAMLCGYCSYDAMAQWGRDYGSEMTPALSFTRDKTPCAATFFNIFGVLELQVLEERLAIWAENMLASQPTGHDKEEKVEAIALDGKTLRGSLKMGAPGAPLLSALSHCLGLTLLQQAVEDETNEVKTVQALLKGLILQGRVVTMDALLTQRAVARTVREKGALRDDC